ncbi:MAG TPA: hypothetical protein VGI40_16590, partial [Pirellulaceae bacterium]
LPLPHSLPHSLQFSARHLHMYKCSKRPAICAPSQNGPSLFPNLVAHPNQPLLPIQPAIFKSVSICVFISR